MKGLGLWFSILALVMVIITAGCGFAIHSGGESFKNAIKGHMVFRIVTVLTCLVSVISNLVSK